MIRRLHKSISQQPADNRRLPVESNPLISPSKTHFTHVLLYPTVRWRPYKRTQNNRGAERDINLWRTLGCVILNLHLPLNTHHPPLNTHTYQDRVGPQQMVPPTKGRVRQPVRGRVHALWLPRTGT